MPPPLPPLMPSQQPWQQCPRLVGVGVFAGPNGSGHGRGNGREIPAAPALTGRLAGGWRWKLGVGCYSVQSRAHHSEGCRHCPRRAPAGFGQSAAGADSDNFRQDQSQAGDCPENQIWLCLTRSKKENKFPLTREKGSGAWGWSGLSSLALLPLLPSVLCPLPQDPQAEAVPVTTSPGPHPGSPSHPPQREMPDSEYLGGAQTQRCSWLIPDAVLKDHSLGTQGPRGMLGGQTQIN